MKPPHTEYAKKDRPLAPVGTHVARLIGVLYVGTVESEYMGEKKFLFKIRLTWELPNETYTFKADEPPKPFVVSQKYTYSLGEKSKFRPLVEGMLGRGLNREELNNFDLDSLVDTPCLLSITHEASKDGTRKFVVVKSAAPLLKGMTCPPRVNEMQILSYEKWSDTQFDKLPEFIREEMEKTPEFKKLKNIPLPANRHDPIDDVPFE